MIKPNKYKTEDIQNELLDIIKIFYLYCEENNIQNIYMGDHFRCCKT